MNIKTQKNSNITRFDNKIGALDNASNNISNDDNIKGIKTDSPDRFINREISWLAFNSRVLEEASNPNHPLLERLRFLSISAKNLDEFYMVRVAGLKAQDKAEMVELSQEGLTPAEQLDAIMIDANNLIYKQQNVVSDILNNLRGYNISLLNEDELNDGDRNNLDDIFMRQIYPGITPLAVDSSHPFPFIPNAGLVMAVELRRPDNKKLQNVLIPIPSTLDRFIRLPGQDSRYVAMENVILICMQRLFPNFTIVGNGMFRIIRDSEVEIDEEAEDLVRTFETLLRQRRRGNVINLELTTNLPSSLKQVVISQFNVLDKDVIELNGYLGLADFNQLIDKKQSELLFESYKPRYPERILDFNNDCFAAIRDEDFIVHHPYESFEVVARFLEQAAHDKKVVAIKQTLYRTSSDSPIVRALIYAAENGKSVTALVELKARFDEAANIKWARDLERAGVQVVYGFLDLKIHSKISMVVRKENKNMRTYLHFGTGNYHPITAKTYADLSFFTCDPALGRDAAIVFNYTTGYATPDKLEKLSMAPLTLRDKIVDNIDKEIAHAKAGRPANIWIKLNSLVDGQVIDKLYEASGHGVKIDIIARGICCLRAGVMGLSENITVKSIVGRFLEHSRIFCFGAGHELPSTKAMVYIASADLMPRNLDRRVETLVPIENEIVKKQVLDQVMVTNLKDEAQSWYMQKDGSYKRVSHDDKAFNAHKFFMTHINLSGRGKIIKK